MMNALEHDLDALLHSSDLLITLWLSMETEEPFPGSVRKRTSSWSRRVFGVSFMSVRHHRYARRDFEFSYHLVFSMNMT